MLDEIYLFRNANWPWEIQANVLQSNQRQLWQKWRIGMLWYVFFYFTKILYTSYTYKLISRKYYNFLFTFSVVDNNGFVIVSDKETQTGKFFGEVDGTILDSLIQHQIYRKIEIYDYQAICLESEDDGSPANFLSNPFRMVQGTICISTYHMY